MSLKEFSANFIFLFQLCHRFLKNNSSLMSHWSLFHRKTHGTLHIWKKYLKGVKKGEVLEIPKDLSTNKSKYKYFLIIVEMLHFLYCRHCHQPCWTIHVRLLWIHLGIKTNTCNSLQKSSFGKAFFL